MNDNIMINKISACLVVYHEEDCIRRCLDSLKGAVDEIIVVHDGPCSDRTLDIAREFTDKVYVHEKKGNGEPIRYYSFEKSSGNWILVIDADEALSFELRNKIRDFVTDNSVDQYIFQWPYYDQNDKIIESSLFQIKKILFRRSKFYQVGLPHMTGESLGGKQKKVDLQLKHFYKKGERSRFFSDFKKDIKRSKIAASLYLHPEKIKSYNCNLNDKNCPMYKKIIFFTKNPIRALFFYPFYRFCVLYFQAGYYRAGIPGFLFCLHLPIYHFLASFYFIKYKFFTKKHE